MPTLRLLLVAVRCLGRHAGLALALALCLAPAASVQADAQISMRNFLEFGQQRKGKELDIREFIVGIGVRADALIGPARPHAFRFGPALEARVVDFYSIEGALGATLLIPAPMETSIGISGLAGYSVRRRGPETPMAIGVFTWGMRDYNYDSRYAWGLNLAASVRRSIGDPDVLEFTGGLEVDMLFTTIIPMLFIRNVFTNDPDPQKARY